MLFRWLLPGFWERPQSLPVQRVEVSPRVNTRAGTVKACRRSYLSVNREGQVNELLIQEGQRVEAIVHFSRESGR
ncbi:hypothetical protein EMIT0194MI4_10003 [Pseudomonas sp. IT-194MI4]